MLRERLSSQLDHDPDFVWRGETVSRLENLTDIVFALALGMLVAGSSPPRDFADLSGFLWSIIPVSAAFAILLSVWNDHFVYFRRYGLADATIIFLNAALLFIVLFLAYPLRFAFEGLFAYIFWVSGLDFAGVAVRTSFREAGWTVALFAAGYGVVNLCLSLMYAHALGKKQVLELTPVESILTRRMVWELGCVFLLSIIVACLAVWSPLAPMAGGLLFLAFATNFALRRVFNPQKAGR